MRLESLVLRNIRNHHSSEIACPAGITLFWGPNGAGKTSILEAAALLCTTRSFVTTRDRSIVTTGAEGYSVEGRFRSDGGSAHEVRVDYPGANGRKGVTFDHAPLAAATDIFGRFPLVILSPQLAGVTAGPPAERRRFVDFVISQTHRQYLMDLIDYRQLLRQRAALLQQHPRSGASLAAQLAPWDESLAQAAVRIVRRRAETLRALQPIVSDTVRAMSGAREELRLEYAASDHVDWHAADAAESFMAELERRLDHDARLGSTGIGPHRDDVSLSINGLDMRLQASQGQHKTVLIALKAAECAYLQRQMEESPMLLLDDVFSELDDERLASVLALLSSFGQVFISSANPAALRAVPGALAPGAVYHVVDGAVAAVGATAGAAA